MREDSMSGASAIQIEPLHRTKRRKLDVMWSASLMINYFKRKPFYHFHLFVHSRPTRLFSLFFFDPLHFAVDITRRHSCGKCWCSIQFLCVITPSLRLPCVPPVRTQMWHARELTNGKETDTDGERKKSNHSRCIINQQLNYNNHHHMMILWVCRRWLSTTVTWCASHNHHHHRTPPKCKFIIHIIRRQQSYNLI